MELAKQICLSSGETLEIPARLFQAMHSETIPDVSVAEPSDPDEDVETHFSLSYEYSQDGLLSALQSFRLQQMDDQRYDESILYVCQYADIKARLVTEAGDPEFAYELLLDSMELGNSAFPCIQLSAARHLADQMIRQAEQVIGFCCLSGSIQVLASRKAGLGQALEVALTFWEPEFAPVIRLLKKESETLLLQMGQPSQPDARNTHEAVIRLKKDVRKLLGHKAGAHPEALENLAASILEMFQQEVLLRAHTAYSSDGLDLETIHYQARRLVEKLEKRLRLVISQKYQQQFGSSWVQHISSKYPPMYERWQRYMQKDHSAFRLYNDYSPEILDYALIEDLKDLIVSQWQLFRDIFNFGYQDRNRSVFLDKISQVISVRNALAHHRTPPENELLRTRVLCTDLLLAMDRSGEFNE